MLFRSPTLPARQRGSNVNVVSERHPLRRVGLITLKCGLGSACNYSSNAVPSAGIEELTLVGIGVFSSGFAEEMRTTKTIRRLDRFNTSPGFIGVGPVTTWPFRIVPFFDAMSWTSQLP